MTPPTIVVAFLLILATVQLAAGWIAEHAGGLAAGCCWSVAFCGIVLMWWGVWRDGGMSRRNDRGWGE